MQKQRDKLEKHFSISNYITVEGIASSDWLFKQLTSYLGNNTNLTQTSMPFPQRRPSGFLCIRIPDIPLNEASAPCIYIYIYIHIVIRSER